MNRPLDPRAFAAEALAALDAGGAIAPFSATCPHFDARAASEAAAAFRALRVARGERPVGRKIGFTNRGIWAEYGVAAPIWGHVYDTTLLETGDGAHVDLGRLPEPRIEPEIVLGLAVAPSPGMTLAELAGCIGWVSHGFEIVQSVFPGWRFAGVDCMANGAMHAMLLCGPRRTVTPDEAGTLAETLSAVAVTLSRNGEVVDRGSGANVLDGPVQALSHLVETLRDDPFNPPLGAGELVSTGTITRAFPVRQGEIWSTEIDGFSLPGLAVRF